MNHRSSFSSYYGSGRVSPYTSRAGHDGRGISQYVEYVEPHNVVDHRASYSGPARGSFVPPGPPYESDEAPDVIHVRYSTRAFHVNFAPYSISESGVLTGDLRKEIARVLDQDHRRVRLVYKEKDLRKDKHPVKHYGLKQNSEVLVEITEHLRDHGDSSSGEEAVASASLQAHHNNDRRRPRGNSSVRYRSDEFGTTPDSNGLLHPLNGQSTNRRRSISRDDGTRTRSRSPAPHAHGQINASHTQTHPPTQTRHRSPPQPRADPSSPMGKVQALEDQYYDKWYPLSQAYLSTPPQDPQTREKEWRKLSESIMRHIIEAADAIELQGDQEARAERKKVLNNAQDLVKRLDAVGKPK